MEVSKAMPSAKEEVADVRISKMRSKALHDLGEKSYEMHMVIALCTVCSPCDLENFPPQSYDD